MVVAALSHPSPVVRAAAVEPWSDFSQDQGDVVLRLVSLASDPNPVVRQAATNELEWLSGRHKYPFVTVAAEALHTLQTNALPEAAP